jgi:glycosyl hydrolase family 113
MKKKIFIGFLLLWLPSFPAEAYQKGVVLGLYVKDPTYTYENELKEIKALGATHVSLVMSWYQKDIHGSDLYPYWKTVGDFDTVPDAQLTRIIDKARAMGLKVFLFPIIRLEQRQPKEWRGVIAPDNLQAWKRSYRRFVMHYARIASAHHVALYSVGSELCSQEQDEAYWRKIITETRKIYHGELTYSANWDHYKKINFWDALDYLGLNGYYEMTASNTPTMDEILKRWWDISNEISNWQETHKKGLIITEIGYPSEDGGCAKPWDYTRDAPVDLEEQALCYQAFFLAWGKSPKLAGVYFWNWYGQGGEKDRSYTPRGKPAEKVLTQWYRDTPSSSSAASSQPPGPSPAAEAAPNPPTSSAVPASPSSQASTPPPRATATP